MSGVGQVTPTPHPTHTHAHTLAQSGEPRSSRLDQTTRKAVIQDHCSRPDPLLSRSTQVPRGHWTSQGQKMEAEPHSAGPSVCIPGGRPRAKKTETSATSRPPAPALLSSHPALTRRWPCSHVASHTSCQPRRCLHRNQKKASSLPQGCLTGHQ